MKHTCLLTLTLALFATSPLQGANHASLAAGAGVFTHVQAGKTINVWYYLPENLPPDAPVLIVMHGTNRDADRYRNEWQPHAERYRFLLLCPEFSKENFPGDHGYNFGNAVDADGHPLPRDQWAFSYLDPVFDHARSLTGNTSETYSLYGHSAGAQFVHRFLYFVPEAKVSRAVAANAGWYTLPDLDVAFPYGLAGTGITKETLARALSRPLVILLGTEDTDPRHKHLRRTPEAMAQGPHRFARGHYFFEYGQRKAAELGATLGWTLATAPGIAHSNRGMATFAADWLFGNSQP